MDHHEIEQLIERILATEDEEIDCDQVFELIARYVDLEVSGEEVAELLPLVYQHLVQCDRCSDLHDTLYELSVMEEQGTLPEVDDLLEDILAGDQGAKANQASGSPRVRHSSSPSPHNSVEVPTLPEDTAFRLPVDNQRLTAPLARLTRWPRVGWFAAAAMLVLTVALGAWGWYTSSQLAQLRNDVTFIAHADRAIWLKGTDQDPDARGYLFIDEAQGRALLAISGLNRLPADKVYQMWIMDGSSASSVGTFTVQSGNWDRFYVDLGPQNVNFTSLAITPEPKDGSETPTGSPVCVTGKQM